MGLFFELRLLDPSAKKKSILGCVDVAMHINLWDILRTFRCNENWETFGLQ